jgi:hypothetical protein
MGPAQEDPIAAGSPFARSTRMVWPDGREARCEGNHLKALGLPGRQPPVNAIYHDGSDGS